MLTIDRLRIATTAIAWLMGMAVAAQSDTLSGMVTDSLTGEAVAYATVYIDGTTIGETTDAQGRYSLSLGELTLPLMLSVTHLSYAPRSQPVHSAGTYSFVLVERSNEIATVTVADSDARAANLSEFRRRFLGEDEWGRGAELVNPAALTFDRTYLRDTMYNADKIVALHGMPSDLREPRWSIDGSRLSFLSAQNLQARSEGPLLVDLPHLGYRLELSLTRFVHTYRDGLTAYYGRLFFRPYGRERKRHLRNRRRAYFGSSQHFLRSLFTGALAANGFEVYTVREDQYLPFDLNARVSRSDGRAILRGLANTELTIVYYADRRGRPLAPEARKRAVAVASPLSIRADTVRLRRDGTTGQSPLLFGGDMGQRGAAWLLPADYRPGEEASENR